MALGEPLKMLTGPKKEEWPGKELAQMGVHGKD